MSRRSRNPLNVGVGDIVLIDFSSIYFRPDRLKRYYTTVLGIQPQYGHTEYGRPLMDQIRYINPEKTELPSFASLLYVVEVAYRNPRRVPVNIFREQREAIAARIQRDPRGTMTGRLDDLVSYEMASLPYQLERPLEPAQVMRYYRTRQGLIRDDFQTITVRRKPFQAWVRRSAFRLMQSTKSIAAEETCEYKRGQDEIHADRSLFDRANNAIKDRLDWANR